MLWIAHVDEQLVVMSCVAFDLSHRVGRRTFLELLVVRRAIGLLPLAHVRTLHPGADIDQRLKGLISGRPSGPDP
ncbi:hypothetical protein SGCZBJ_03935 [Caulobacter zeae]|uniref:Uncharacterized protein n=1 Tax=Caulobacter zeae TaxID=2055137 RepID=A0A2N5DQ32_9CAUL|nr:hypothetical protein SGCZBJ_03935 [Caulobacter zeae]